MRPPKSDTKKNKTKTKSPYKPKLLILDPENTYREILSDLLSERLNLSFAPNPDLALKQIAKEDFTLVVTEIRLPDNDIKKFIQKARSFVPNTTFVVITQEGDMPLALEVLQLGAVDFIAKPFSLDQIAALIDKYLSQTINKKFDYDLIELMYEESRTYMLPNNLYVINPFVSELMEMLKRFKELETKDLFAIRLCVYEMLVNAVEHGNLEIDFSLKNELLNSNVNYLEFVQKRSKEPKYKNRKVMFKYEYSPEKLKFVIEDQGNGFESAKYKKKMQGPIDSLHGRGIIISKVHMDEIKYNDKGNRVTLVKKISGNGDSK